METIVVYIFKSSGLMALFYFAYLLLLRKETFFTSNRWFLLSGLVTSILLPLFFVKKIVLVEAPKINLNDTALIPTQTQTSITEIPATSSFDLSVVLWFIYGCVVLYFIIKLVFSFISLYKLLYNESIKKSGNFKLVNLNQNIAPFSFFNYIVYNSKLYSETELDSILLHEKIHSREKHSLDVLISQLLCALFWFNPIVWFYKKAILQNLEYIADQKATEQLEDKKSYQMALLKVVSHQNCLSITNNFYQSLIKKRIVMLNKNQSRKISSWKYSLVLPFLVGFIFLFQIEIEAQIKHQSADSLSTSLLSSSTTFSSIVTKSTTDRELRELEKTFTTKTEKLIISNVKRNNKGEITEIKLVFDTGKTYVTVMERKAKEGITDIKIYVNTDSNNKKEAGFEDVSEVKTAPVEVFDEFGIRTIDNVDEKQTYWSMDNMKKDGKEVVLIINGKVKGATEKIKLPMSQKLGEMKALTAAEFENKYNQKADKNKLYYEVETVKIESVKSNSNEVVKISNEKKLTVSAEYNPTDDNNQIEKIKKNKNIDYTKALILYNGKEINNSELDEIDPLTISVVSMIPKNEYSLKKYGKKANSGIIKIESSEYFEKNNPLSKSNNELENKKVLELKAKQNSKFSKTEIEERFEERKLKLEERKKILEERKNSMIIFQNDNGDDIVFFPFEKSLKVPSYPSIKFTENSPILILNGVEQTNPSATLNQIDLQKVKSIRVYDENNKETKGSQIKKIIITTK